VSDTRTRILDEAMGLFLVGGYTATSLRMIADAIGITQAAVYYHFRAKDDLLVALVDPLMSSYDAVLAAAEERADRERVVDRRALLGAILDHLRVHRDALRLATGDLAVGRHPAYAPRIERAANRFAALVAAPGDLAAVTLARAALAVLVTPVVELSAAEVGEVREVLLDAAVRVLDTPYRPTSNSAGSRVGIR
jgi:AcrR family transcriptional regulator